MFDVKSNPFDWRIENFRRARVYQRSSTSRWRSKLFVKIDYNSALDGRTNEPTNQPFDSFTHSLTYQRTISRTFAYYIQYDQELKYKACGIHSVQVIAALLCYLYSEKMPGLNFQWERNASIQLRTYNVHYIELEIVSYMLDGAECVCACVCIHALAFACSCLFEFDSKKHIAHWRMSFRNETRLARTMAKSEFARKPYSARFGHREWSGNQPNI